MDVKQTANSESHFLDELYDKIIQFPLALPGFKDHKQFVLTRGEGEAPFFTLRSISDARIGLTVVEPSVIIPDYNITVDDAELIPISSPSPEDCGLLLVVVLEPGTATKVRVKANLFAPIVINKKEKLAAQVTIKNHLTGYSGDAVFEF